MSKQSDAEKEVMAIYRESAPDERKLFWQSHVNHVAWSLLLVVIAFAFWLVVALANAENQRNAYATGKCADPMFKGETDMQCMKTVRTRDHWWQHVVYALGHTSP